MSGNGRRRRIAMERSTKVWIGIGIAIVVGLIGLSIWRAGWLHYVENFELAYSFDTRTGEIQPINHTGYVDCVPFLLRVQTIDLLPMQLCISANKLTLNCKLVQFNPQ